jgi:hypothetical protein
MSIAPELMLFHSNPCTRYWEREIASTQGPDDFIIDRLAGAKRKRDHAIDVNPNAHQ